MLNTGLEDRDPGVFNVLDYGAVFDGVTDDQPAFQAAINAAVAADTPFVLQLPVGTALINDELDFSQVQHSYVVVGAGPSRTIIEPGPFGASKKLFKLDHNLPGARLTRTTLRGFRIQRSTQNKAHPVAVYHPWANRFTVVEVDIAGIGNTGLWIGAPFNCDLRDINVVGCGYQPLEKVISAWNASPRASTQRFSWTAGLPTVSCTDEVFHATDVGRTFFLDDAGPLAPTFNNKLATTIRAVNSATSVEVSPTPYVSQDDGYASFEGVKGSISQGSTALTLNANVLEEGDLGRFVYVAGAGSDGGSVLVTSIASVTSGTECTLADAAAETVSGAYVWFTPAVFMGRLASDVSGQGTNDIYFNGLNVESFRGVGVMIHGPNGIHVFFDHLKTHGVPGKRNDFGASKQPIVLSSCRHVVIDKWQLEHGVTGPDTGALMVLGQHSGFLLGSTVYSSVTSNTHLVDFRSTDSVSYGVIGQVAATADLSADPALVKMADVRMADRVVTEGPVLGVAGRTDQD